MKAVVLEVNDKESAVLREDGTFETISGVYTVGETIELPEADSPEPIPFVKRNSKVLKWIISAAAVVILAAAMFGVYSYQNLMVYASVRVEGDVALEYDLNRRGNVIAVRALNEAGEEVAGELSEQGIKNLSLEETLERVSVIEEKLFSAEDISPEIHVQVTGSNEEKISVFEDIVNEYYGTHNTPDLNSETGALPQDQPAADNNGQSGAETLQPDSDISQDNPGTLQPDQEPAQPGAESAQPGLGNTEPGSGSDSSLPIQEQTAADGQPQQSGNVPAADGASQP